LTLSRVVIGLVILALSFVGSDAYMAVVILLIIGGITDVFDGRVARRYLGEKREGALGKHDLVIDTLFVLCALAYFSFSGIVIPKLVGFGWIGLAVVAIVACKRKPKILFLFEIPTVLALIAIAGLYDFRVFALIALPAICGGLVINYKRIRYLLFEYIPNTFSE
jgi:phosphatidylglycerophosphate synthase